MDNLHKCPLIHSLYNVYMLCHFQWPYKQRRFTCIESTAVARSQRTLVPVNEYNNNNNNYDDDEDELRFDEF